MDKPKKNRSIPYAYVLIFSVLFVLYNTIAGNIGSDFRLFEGISIFLFLLIGCYFNVKNTFLTVLFFLPILIGLDSYQINVGPFLNFIARDRELYVNSFSLACIFLIFLSTIELAKRIKEIKKTPLIYIISLAVISSMISLAGSKYILTGFVFEIYLISGFCSYFLGYFLLGEKRAYLKALATVIFSSFIPAIVGILQFFGGNFLFEGDSNLGRIQSTLPHSNTFGSFLFMVLTVFLVTLLAVKISRNNKDKNNHFEIFCFIPFIILVGLLVLTYSRTAWIGFAISVSVIAIIKPDFRLPIIYLGSLSLTIMMILQRTRDRIFGIFNRYMYDSLYGRFETWDMAIFEFKKKPLIGYGIGSFEEVIKDTQGKETGNVYSHNDSIRFLLEGGLLGFFSYVFYMAGAIYYALKSFLSFPKESEKIKIWGHTFIVDFKLLGLIPLLLFAITALISFVESPSMDFVFQMICWALLGSWLGLNSSKLKIKS